MRPRIASVSSVSSSDYSEPVSSTSTVDEDELNLRIKPHWEKYISVFRKRGYRLETSQDARRYYEKIFHGPVPDTPSYICYRMEYARVCVSNPDALCKDAGLPDTLFRGTRVQDGKRIVAKAVCLRSRQFQIVRILSSPPLRYDPRNKTIPVLDLIVVPEDDVGFIVQEEWSSQLIDPSNPCPKRDFLRAVRQCIEGLVFMHAHGIAHLDISLRNILTDFRGRYRYIDFEMSRLYGVSNGGGGAPTTTARIQGYRGTEIPPEIERGEVSDPFKVDVWALGIVILQALKICDYTIDGLIDVVRPMLTDSFAERPSACSVLAYFDRVFPHLMDEP